MKEKKTLYYLVKQLDACFSYRILWPSKYLQRNHNWECYYDKIDDLFYMNQDGSYNYDKIKPGRLEILEQCDLVVLQRGTDAGHLQLLRFIRDQFKKPIIYECFTYDNEVMTEFGLMRIGDIVEEGWDVKVYSDDGKLYPIDKHFSREFDGWVYRIKTWYLFDEIECTDSHKLIAHKGGFNDEIFEEIEVKHLRKGDFLKIPFLKINCEVPMSFDLADYIPDGWNVEDDFVYKVSNCKTLRYIDFDYDLSRLFGYFLSEGCVNNSNRSVTFSFHIDERIYIDDVLSIVKSKFGHDASVYSDYHESSVRIQINSKIVGLFFNDIFGENVRAPTKKVPNFYFSSIDLRYVKEMLLGLFRGDGSNVKNIGFRRGARLTTSSKTMLYQVHNLLLRFGIIASVYKLWRSGKEHEIRGRTVNSGDGYELKVNVVDDIESIDFKERCELKTKNLNLKGKVDLENEFAWVEIQNISREKKKVKVFNICVNPRHTYNVRTIASANSDDDYINVPEWNTGYRYFAPRKAEIVQMISEVDAVTVTVPSLRDLYSKYNPRIKILKNCLDFEKIDKSPALVNDSKMLRASMYRCPRDYLEESLRDIVLKQVEAVINKEGKPLSQENIDAVMNGPVQFNVPVNFDWYRAIRDDEKKLLLGWGGSPTHILDIEVMRDPVMKVMSKYRFLHLVFVGYLHMMSLLRNSPYGANVRKWLIGMDLKRFWIFHLVGVKHYYSLYKALEFDIGLAPVSPVQFNASKSNLKVIEYMALGMYPMASDFTTYHGVMVPEGKENEDVGVGRLCKTQDDWEHNLYDVLNDHDMRAESVYHNDLFVRKHYDIDFESEHWDKFYRSLL